MTEGALNEPRLSWRPKKDDEDEIRDLYAGFAAEADLIGLSGDEKGFGAGMAEDFLAAHPDQVELFNAEYNAMMAEADVAQARARAVPSEVAKAQVKLKQAQVRLAEVREKYKTRESPVWLTIQRKTGEAAPSYRPPQDIMEIDDILVPYFDKDDRKTVRFSGEESLHYHREILELLTKSGYEYSLVVGRHKGEKLGYVLFIIDQPPKMILSMDEEGAVFIIHGNNESLPWKELACLAPNHLKALRCHGLVSEVESGIRDAKKRLQMMKECLGRPNPRNVPADIIETAQQPLAPLNHEPFPLLVLYRRYGHHYVQRKLPQIMAELAAAKGAEGEDNLMEPYLDSHNALQFSYPAEADKQLADGYEKVFKNENWWNLFQIRQAVIQELARRGRPLKLQHETVVNKVLKLEALWQAQWNVEEKGPYKREENIRSGPGGKPLTSLFIVADLAQQAVKAIVDEYMSYRKQPEDMMSHEAFKRILLNRGYVISADQIKAAINQAAAEGKKFLEIGLGGRNQEAAFYDPSFPDYVIKNGFTARRRR